MPADAAGGGWVIRAGFSASRFGICLVAESPRGICHLSFMDTSTEGHAWADFLSEWPGATVLRDDHFTAEINAALFARNGREDNPRSSVRVVVRGTPFQVNIWRALLKIPAGSVTSYSDLAKACGRPDAVRAVASAVGQNRVAYLIPCHRVVRKGGKLGGFRWGVDRKRNILDWEAAARGSST